MILCLRFKRILNGPVLVNLFIYLCVCVVSDSSFTTHEHVHSSTTFIYIDLACKSVCQCKNGCVGM